VDWGKDEAFFNGFYHLVRLTAWNCLTVRN